MSLKKKLILAAGTLAIAVLPIMGVADASAPRPTVHVVTVPFGNYTGRIDCPAGEIALSVAFSFAAGPVAVYWKPTLNGQPVPEDQAPDGYIYTTAQNYQPTAYLTCAEVF